MSEKRLKAQLFVDVGGGERDAVARHPRITIRRRERLSVLRQLTPESHYELPPSRLSPHHSPVPGNGTHLHENDGSRSASKSLRRPPPPRAGSSSCSRLVFRDGFSSCTGYSRDKLLFLPLSVSSSS